MARKRHRKSKAHSNEDERESGDDERTSPTIAPTEPRLTPQQRAGIQVAYQKRQAEAQKLADQVAKERATARLDRLLQAGREEVQAILERETADRRQHVEQEIADRRREIAEEEAAFRQLRQQMEQEASALRQQMEQEASALRQQMEQEAAALRQQMEQEAAASRQRIEQDAAQQRQQSESALAGEIAEARAREDSRLASEYTEREDDLNQQLEAYRQRSEADIEASLAQRWTDGCEKVDDELARQLELRLEEAADELLEQRAQHTVPVLPAWWLRNGSAQPAGAQGADQRMEEDTEPGAEEWVNPEWRAMYQRSTVDAAPGTAADQPGTMHGDRLITDDSSEEGSSWYSPTAQFRRHVHVPETPSFDLEDIGTAADQPGTMHGDRLITDDSSEEGSSWYSPTAQFRRHVHVPETPSFDLEDIGTALVDAHNAPPASVHGRQVSADTDIGAPQPPAEAPSSP
ncbi:hypothetical protein CBOM_03469 [Ceraceosorus bombacis]|uniref:Uncharacterized protein n=1 Tax=Ceraceosorus bombacis TaxID=401625 RepID=A0A0N7LAS8_9BASI|nr:hypothetical protein CBOM_03469 [Ceraceosorus bombacis]